MGPSDKKSAREYSNEHYKNYSERIKENVKRYKETYPERVLETRLKTCKKNPTAKNAHRAVAAAIRAGVIERPNTCSGCGCSNTEHRIEAHHYDYGDPLNVIWLCTPCHRALDANRRVHEGKTPYGKRGKTTNRQEALI